MKDHEHHHGEAHGHDLNVKKIDRLSSTRVRLTVEFSEQTVKEHEKATTNRYLNAARIPGFRPGKAPLKMVRERYKSEIQKDVVSHLLEAGLAEAIEKTKLMPVNRPRIELGDGTLSEGKPFEFHAEFEVQPEIEVRNYKGVRLKKQKLEATDEEVNQTIDNLRERFAVLEPSASKKAEKGQFATVEIGYELTADPTVKEPAKPFTIGLGEGRLLPELEQAFLEMGPGDSRKITGKFPDKYEDAKLAGKEAAFDCKLLELKTKTLPEVNDAFAGQIREGATLLSLRQEIRSSIESSKQEDQQKAQRGEVVEYLIAQNHFDVPASLVEQQARSLLQWMEQDLKKRGMSVQNLGQEELENVRKRAEHMVRSSLLLKEIALKEKISLDESKVREKVEAIAAQLQRSPEETEKFLSGKGMLDRLRDEVLTDQIFDFLIKNAEFEEAAPRS